MKVSVVIPTYNEGILIRRVLERLPSIDEIIVVDDGSKDDVEEFVKGFPVRLMKHEKNMGKGVAMNTGMKMARGDVVVFLDADMQHNPCDIPRLTEPIEAGRADFVIGARLLERNRMPYIRRFANYLGNKLIELFVGMRLKDTQSGFRAVKREFLEKMTLRGRFEVEMEMLIYAQRLGARIEEIPIETRYGEEKSHFKPRDLIRVVWVFLR